MKIYQQNIRGFIPLCLLNLTLSDGSLVMFKFREMNSDDQLVTNENEFEEQSKIEKKEDIQILPPSDDSDNVSVSEISACSFNMQSNLTLVTPLSSQPKLQFKKTVPVKLSNVEFYQVPKSIKRHAREERTPMKPKRVNIPRANQTFNDSENKQIKDSNVEANLRRNSIPDANVAPVSEISIQRHQFSPSGQQWMVNNKNNQVAEMHSDNRMVDFRLYSEKV